MDIKGPAVTAGAMLVAGVLVWVTGLGGKEWILDHLSKDAIAVIPADAEFYADQRIDFRLENTTPDSVLWICDARDIHPASIEFQYSFPYDPHKQAGVLWSHTVDAIYWTGTHYRWLRKSVLTKNAKITATLHSVDSQNAQIDTLMTALGQDWVIQNAALSSLDARGSFRPVQTLSFREGSAYHELLALVSSHVFSDVSTGSLASSPDKITYVTFDAKNASTGQMIPFAAQLLPQPTAQSH